MIINFQVIQAKKLMLSKNNIFSFETINYELCETFNFE